MDFNTYFYTNINNNTNTNIFILITLHKQTYIYSNNLIQII